jgi:glycerophosphoryl diester phosphodiesterase
MRCRKFGFLLVMIGLGLSGVAGRAEPVPLVRAHAHNDYEHARPLFDALDCGFGSIEADVHLVNGALLVAHDAKDVKPGRTLEALYLAPLRERVRANGGRVYRGGPTIILLVDVKTEAEATYAALDVVLKTYAEMLTRFADGAVQPAAVTVIVSGNRARATMAAQTFRYAALDGRIEDLTGAGAGAAGPALIPLVSDNWSKVFGGRWSGPLSPAVAAKLKSLVESAHARGQLIRFWNTPDTSDVWGALREAGVDLINTDRLTELRDFLRAEAKARP